MDAVSLKIPETLNNALERQARELGLRKSQLMRKALEDFVQAQQGTTKTSLLDQISDLAGTVEGPADLSRNPKYLHGYGE